MDNKPQTCLPLMASNNPLPWHEGDYSTTPRSSNYDNKKWSLWGMFRRKMLVSPAGGQGQAPQEANYIIHIRVIAEFLHAFCGGIHITSPQIRTIRADPEITSYPSLAPHYIGGQQTDVPTAEQLLEMPMYELNASEGKDVHAWGVLQLARAVVGYACKTSRPMLCGFSRRGDTLDSLFKEIKRISEEAETVLCPYDISPKTHRDGRRIVPSKICTPRVTQHTSIEGVNPNSRNQVINHCMYVKFSSSYYLTEACHRDFVIPKEHSQAVNSKSYQQCFPRGIWSN